MRAATRWVVWLRVLAVVLVLVDLGLECGVGLPLSVALHRAWGDTASNALVVVAFTGVGGLVAVRKTANALGWLMLVFATFFTLQLVATQYSSYDYRLHHGALAFGPLAVVLSEGWAPAIGCLVVAVLIFPDGRLLSGPSRWLVWGIAVLCVAWQAGACGIAIGVLAGRQPVRIDRTGTLVQLDHPTGATAWWGVLQVVFFTAVIGAFVYWVVVQAIGYRTLTGERRTQQKWLFTGAVLLVVGGMLSVALGSADTALGHAVSDIGTASLVGLPLAIGVAIVKFRLYDIDRLLSRGIAYLLLTGLVVGVYVGIVSLAEKALSFSSPVAVAASTLVALAVFAPLRRRVQQAVDRRFNRAHYDAESAVSAFAARLRDVFEVERVSDDLLGVVRSTVEPAAVSVILLARNGD